MNRQPHPCVSVCVPVCVCVRACLSVCVCVPVCVCVCMQTDASPSLKLNESLCLQFGVLQYPDRSVRWSQLNSYNIKELRDNI